MEPKTQSNAAMTVRTRWLTAGAFALPVAMIGLYLLIKSAITGGPVTPAEIRFFLMALFAIVGAHAARRAGFWARFPEPIRKAREDVTFVFLMGLVFAITELGAGARHWDLALNVLITWARLMLVMVAVGGSIWLLGTFLRRRRVARATE